MSSDNKPDVASERETRFIPRSDDEEVLWTVQEITAERGKTYKVRWAGTDPATGKPWQQSWVAKHDCTDDLVYEWMAKKKRQSERKKRGRKSTVSRASQGSSKRAGSLGSGKKTRPSTSEATPSRLDSVQERLSPQSTAKRKRAQETLATTTSGAVQVADGEGESSRPRKKQKIKLEDSLLPAMSSDDDAVEVLEILGRTKGTVTSNSVPVKSTRASLDEEDGSLSKAKGKSLVRSKNVARVSESREEMRVRDSKKMKAKVVVTRREERVDAVVSPAVLSQDEEPPRPVKSKKKPTSKRKSASEQNDGPSVAAPIKVGPPVGVKRREVLRKSTPPSKPGASRTKSREHNGRVTEESRARPDDDVSMGKPRSLRQDAVNSSIPTSPPLQISIPHTPSTRSHSPELSPGTKARLELFDRMITDAPQLDVVPSPADVPEDMPNDTLFNDNDTYDDFEPPPPLSPSPSKSKPKHVTPNGFVVPETELSGNSQSEEQSLPKLPPSPVRESMRRPVDLPSITVITAPATSTSLSPQDPFPESFFPPTNRPPKQPAVKPVKQISQNIFRSATHARSHVTDSEPPPSSIESFASPERVDKGKQRAIDEDQLEESSPSEGEGDGGRWKKPTQKKVTDSGLKKRGKEIFDQVHLTREAVWLKNRKPKRLKAIDDIVNRTTSKGSSLPSNGGGESAWEVRWNEVIDLSGGANSATLDTVEQTQVKALSEEQRDRLRIELREEEEENTQEAMGVFPPVPKGVNGGDAQMPPPRSPEFSTRAEDLEQPSTDLQLASVVVQASQGRTHEDTDVEPLPANQRASSPPCPIPENMTDSPKRRLGEALSLLNLKSEEIQRLERELADERKKSQDLRLELDKLQQSSEPTGPVRVAWEVERAQWTRERTKWESEFAMWETQRKEWCDDKTNLSARVSELSDAAVRAEQVSAKLAELEAERVTWTKERDAPLSTLTERSEELVKARDEEKRGNETSAEAKSGWETERTTLQEKQESLSRSVDELTASVQSLTSAKISAEKDKEFFREQYAQASGFADSVREENEELEKRVRIAEGQAQEGVAVIKAFYEGRIKALQADVGRWKSLTELLQEKDRRTNDELRLRAAQAPELSELCGRLMTENESLEVDVRKLGRVQERSVVQRNKLYFEILLLKKERASLRSKLSKRGSKRAPPAAPESQASDNMPDPTPRSSDTSFDEPALFPCMWRPQWRDQCQHVFDAKEDLERHVQEHFRNLSKK